jgi:hypothetical protein
VSERGKVRQRERSNYYFFVCGANYALHACKGGGGLATACRCHYNNYSTPLPQPRGAREKKLQFSCNIRASLQYIIEINFGFVSRSIVSEVKRRNI